MLFFIFTVCIPDDDIDEDDDDDDDAEDVVEIDDEFVVFI